MTDLGPLADDEDDVLVARARSGDGEALERLVARHHGLVYRYLLSRTGDQDRSADLTQETFLKALRGFSSFRGDSSIRTWLLAIATNELRADHRRGVRRREVALDPASRLPHPGERPDARVVRLDEVGRIRTALSDLPEKQRLSVSLRLFDGLSFREIGQATGSTEGAARVNFFHGIRRLRDKLEDRE